MGIHNFPDPTFRTGGGMNVNVGPGINPQPPAFKHAVSVCGGGVGLPDLPSG